MARFGSHFFSTSHTFFFGLLHICRPCRSTFFCCFPKYFFACGSLGFFFSLSFIFWPCLAYGTISGPQVSAFLPCVRLLPPYGSIFFFFARLRFVSCFRCAARIDAPPPTPRFVGPQLLLFGSPMARWLLALMTRLHGSCRSNCLRGLNTGTVVIVQTTIFATISTHEVRERL
ncbi:hypothetical protein B0H13DRAFT_1003394 [Mycena leptocephala]|nr:hypothetical protein B0H13DRAFT_1003394 [Mycena leptocephala]